MQHTFVVMLSYYFIKTMMQIFVEDSEVKNSESMLF